MVSASRAMRVNASTPRNSIYIDDLAALEHFGEGSLLAIHEEHGGGVFEECCDSHHVGKRCESGKVMKECNLPQHLAISGRSILRRE